MKTARIIVLFFVFFVFLSGAVSEEKIREDLTFDLFESGNEKADYDSLLEGYKKNSTELERLYIKLKQAESTHEERLALYHFYLCYIISRKDVGV